MRPSKAAGIPFNADQALVGVISHALKGMEYSFAEERIEWSWLEMVAQLTNESMKKVVEGEDGRSRGHLLAAWSDGPSLSVRTATTTSGTSPQSRQVVTRRPRSCRPGTSCYFAMTDLGSVFTLSGAKLQWLLTTSIATRSQ